jgi:preprotein translocase subunit SecE
VELVKKAPSVVEFVAVKVALNYFGEVRSELKKVIWPKREEVIRLTMVVLSISAIVGLYLGGLDYFFTKLIGIIIGR